MSYYQYTSAHNDVRTRLPAHKLKSGMFVMHESRWALVLGYNQQTHVLSLINARRGGIKEEKVMRPDFVVSVRVREEE